MDAATPAERNKFETLCAILDRMIDVGIAETVRRAYSQAYQTPENLSQARALVFIHRYLEVTKNITDFVTRENLITDGPLDGGIDAYYIDKKSRVVEIIQSKFRATAANFIRKTISVEEIAAIDLDILRGKTHDKSGISYNGKVQQLVREIASLENPSTYQYKLVLLANVSRRSYAAISKLFPDLPVDVWDFRRSYNELVLPILKGEQYSSRRLSIAIDISKKNTDARLTSEVEIAYGICGITIALIPTIEIAKAVSKYRNTLLRFNPRAYLGFGSQGTNAAIRSSICDINTGEFAILNNGLTIVVDEVFFSSAVGRTGRAEMTLVNPQIVNGGQTAFTISNTYSEIDEALVHEVFKGKEVIIKVIRLPDLGVQDREALVHEISEATNTQTTVLPADRVSNFAVQRAIMDRMFLVTGLLYEFRSGEFWQAIADGTVDESKIINRTLFTRLFFIAIGDYNRATVRSIFKKGRNQFESVPPEETLQRVALVWGLYGLLDDEKSRRVEQRQLFYAGHDTSCTHNSRSGTPWR